MRPSSPIVSFLGKYFVLIFLAKGVKYPGFSSRVLWRRCWSGMGCKLIAMGLGFSLAFVLASTVAVMVMPVMAGVMTASIVVTTVVTTMVSLRRFRWTVASWPCVLMLRWCALIMPVHFPTGTRRGRRLCRREKSDFASSCCPDAWKAEAGGAFSCSERAEGASLG